MATTKLFKSRDGQEGYVTYDKEQGFTITGSKSYTALEAWLDALAKAAAEAVLTEWRDV